MRATYKRPAPYCSECGRKGEPGGICEICKAHWHGTHTVEDCRHETRLRRAREKALPRSSATTPAGGDTAAADREREGEDV